jgi:hypothetical protein
MCPAQLRLRGRDKIFGLYQFWASLNRKVDINVIRVGEDPWSWAVFPAACAL